MLIRVVLSSIRHRAKLYIPMLLAVALSLSLIGASEMVEKSFDSIVDREMKKYGANVILKPEKGVAEVFEDEWVAVYVKTVRMGEAEVSVAVTDIERILEMNPAWVVRGDGEILVGRELAEKLGIKSGDVVEAGEVKGRVAILDSGTEFDSFVVVNGTAEMSTMILIRTDNPEKYRYNAIILDEMVRTKFSFLKGIKKLLLYIAAVSAISSLITITNLSRIDAGKRRKEFGVMRAVGADTKIIGKFILTEFGFLALLAASLGILLSLILSWVILISAAGTLPEFSIRASINLFLLSVIAFCIVFLIYLAESVRKEVVNELRGE